MSKNHFSTTYDSKWRFISYWHQAHEILSLNPSSVLEVGVGSGFLGMYLKSKGVNLTSVDIDTDLKPDVVASITKLPFETDSFDVTVAFEVLEHMPYEEAKKGIEELARVSKNHVVISMPEATRFLKLEFPIPKIKRVKKIIELPWLKFSEPLHDDHAWELGLKAYSLDRIKEDLQKAGLKLKRTYRVFENPRHRFFILRLK